MAKDRTGDTADHEPAGAATKAAKDARRAGEKAATDAARQARLAGERVAEVAKQARRDATRAARTAAREQRKHVQAAAKQAHRAGLELQRLEHRLVQAQSILAEVSDRATALQVRVAAFRASLDGHAAPGAEPAPRDAPPVAELGQPGPDSGAAAGEGATQAGEA